MSTTEAALEPAETQTVVRRLDLEAGIWQVRLVAMDRANGALGSVVHTFEVPPADR